MDLSNVSLDEINSIFNEHEPKPEGDYKYHSVMVLLFEIDNELHMLFNKRALSLRVQPGEICFPGGRAEVGETHLETAYREVYEELGIKKEEIRLLGQPDYIITHSGNIIIPFVGFVESIAVEKIKYNTEEVHSIFAVPLKFFSQSSPVSSFLNLNPSVDEGFPVDMLPKGREYKFSTGKILELFYQYEEFTIWGLTARIARNVCDIIERGLR